MHADRAERSIDRLARARSSQTVQDGEKQCHIIPLKFFYTDDFFIHMILIVRTDDIFICTDDF